MRTQFVLIRMLLLLVVLYCCRQSVSGYKLNILYSFTLRTVAHLIGVEYSAVWCRPIVINILRVANFITSLAWSERVSLVVGECRPIYMMAL